MFQRQLVKHRLWLYKSKLWMFSLCVKRRGKLTLRTLSTRELWGDLNKQSSRQGAN